MLRNHLKTALRSILRTPGTAFINIIGLAVAVACGLVIFLFVQHELSYDRFHEQADRIYRLTFERQRETGLVRVGTTAPPMGPAIAERFPEVERAVRFRYARDVLLAHGDRRFYEDRLFYVDSTFFDVFSFPLRRGNSATALQDPSSIVLTTAAAEKYFGDIDPVGQTLRFNDERTVTVTGVLEPLPSATHLPFDALVPFAAFRVPPGYTVTLDDWGWGSFHTYLLLDAESDPAALEAQFPALIEAHFPPEVAQGTRLGVQPITDIYLDTIYQDYSGVVASGNVIWLYGLGVIGMLLLVIAGFNYINLATAQAIGRAREVGVRKAIGAGRRALVGQFMGEAMLMCGASTVIGVLLALLFLKGPAEAFGVDVAVRASDLGLLLAGGAGTVLVLSGLAGSYPALVLARFDPIRVLKGPLPTGVAGSGVRRTLVVGQFAASMVLVVGTFIIMRQMDYVRTKDLGFDQEQVVALHLTGDAYSAYYERIRDRLIQNPRVASVSAGDLFDGTVGSVPIYSSAVENPNPEGTVMNIFGIHFGFLETVGIDVVQGRGLTRSMPSDSARGIILNQAAVDAFGWDEPIGKPVRVFNIREGEVIGVVENFHFASLREAVAPLVMYLPRANMGNVLVRMAPGDPGAALDALRGDWNAVVPNLPFDYAFLDDHVDQMYRAEARFARLTHLFAGIAILVACFGLYGLVALAVRQRTRELAIRKVLGGSLSHLIRIVAGRFVGLVALACVIAGPVAYAAGQRWLQDFAYRADLGPGLFLGAGMLILGVATIAVSVQSVRAALVDPAPVLRRE